MTVTDAGDILHQAQRVTEHLFEDVHVFGHQWIGIVQRMQFGRIVEVALDKVAHRRVGWQAKDVECKQHCIRQKVEPADR